MKSIILILWAACFLAAAATFGQSLVTLTVDPQERGYLIPDDFAGIGFETGAELPNHYGVKGNLFSPANTQLITLFTNTGIRNLRLGGGTVDGPRAAIPSRADIDNVFGFARAAGIKVIYSLPLLDGDSAEAAATAKYIWDRYRPCLDCFSIGNEPNEPPYRDASVGAITNYAQFLAAWRTFAAAVTNAVPGAKFTGPEAGGWDWVPQFANAEKSSGKVILITHHEYVGGKPYIHHGKDEMPAATAIDNMLSRYWVTNKCPEFYKKTLAQVKTTGLPCRMTEANDYLRGVTNASDAFASALWALDYMHWWAARGLAGVNFHNNQWLRTDTFYLDKTTGEYQIHPKAYGIGAFDLGGHGWTKSVAAKNRDNLNLTAYAVGDGTNLFVTVINKEHGASPRDANVTIALNHLPVKNAEAIYLTAPDNDAGAVNGIALGEASIDNHSAWHGRWKALSVSKGQCNLIVPATSAVVVKLFASELK
jgi:hypothetical protein